MNSKRNLVIAKLVYDEVHAALWAIAGAAVIYSVVFVAQKLPEARAQAEFRRSEQINAEHEWYCQRWKMGPGTPMHGQCVLDLQEFRAGIENRIARDSGF